MVVGGAGWGKLEGLDRGQRWGRRGASATEGRLGFIPVGVDYVHIGAVCLCRGMIRLGCNRGSETVPPWRPELAAGAGPKVGR